MKLINTLLVIWMFALTGAHFYMIQTHKQFLRFESLIMTDNLKNQIVYDKKTYYLYTVALEGQVENDKRFPVMRPVYIEKAVYEKLVDHTRISLAEKGVH